MRSQAFSFKNHVCFPASTLTYALMKGFIGEPLWTEENCGGARVFDPQR